MPISTPEKATSFHPFAGRDVPWLVDAQAAARPDKPFIRWVPVNAPARTVTYGVFAEETRRYAAGLAERGIVAGDHVIIHLDNCPEFMIAWMACSRLGAVAVTTNTSSTAADLAYLIDQSRAVAVITQPRYVALVREAKQNLRWIACLRSDCDELTGFERPADCIAFEALRGDPRRLRPRSANPTLPNNVVFTSGTTSRPKGVVWTHANALWSARATTIHTLLTDHDVALIFFPLFHTNALAWSMLATLYSGGTAVLLPRFSSSRFWDIAQRYSCTWASMFLFTVRALLNVPDPERHSFRFWGCLGDLSAVRERWGIRTIGWYGMTETVAPCVVSDYRHGGPESSIGRVTPEYEVAIRNDGAEEVSAGEVGSLWIRGRPGISLFQSYLHDPAVTVSAFDAQGWFETGDRVIPLADGHIMFSGRSKDTLRIGGENVAALEIETKISSVAGVVEAAVVGRPDPMLGEVPVAFVVAAAPGPELATRIHDHCRDALAAFKRPREIRFVDALPKGLLQKVLKKELRERLAADVGVVSDSIPAQRSAGNMQP